MARPKRPGNIKTFTVAIDKEVQKKFKIACIEDEVSISSVNQELIEDWLRKRKKSNEEKTV